MAQEEKFEIDDIKDPLELEESEISEEGDDLGVEEVIPEEEPSKEKAETKKKKVIKKATQDRSEKVRTKEVAVKDGPQRKEPDVLERVLTEEVATVPKPVEKKKRSVLRTISLVAITMLVTSAALLGGIYFWLNKDSSTEKVATENVQEEKKPIEKEVEKEKIVYASSEIGLNLRKEPSITAEILVVIPQGTKLTVLATEGEWYKTKYQDKEGWVSKGYVSEKNPMVYENNNYGFSLTFPESWVGYKVFPMNLSADFSEKVFYVALPTTDKNWDEMNIENGYSSLFAISVMTKEQWEKTQAEEGPKPTLIKEGATYVYAWSSAQAGPKDHESNTKDVKTIISSFELK